MERSDWTSTVISTRYGARLRSLTSLTLRHTALSLMFDAADASTKVQP
jgi:hypothetical protein